MIRLPLTITVNGKAWEYTYLRDGNARFKYIHWSFNGNEYCYFTREELEVLVDPALKVPSGL